jgi:7-carboxy-7-deazaguanine synthase
MGTADRPNVLPGIEPITAMTAAFPAHRTALLLTRPPGTLLVHEIYRSVQGESTFAGLPCVFVRLSVCGQRCRWCDTPHAFTQGEPVTPAAVFDRVVAYGTPLVEFTGGEPLLQNEALPLMTRLADVGLTVLLETGGAVDVTPVDRRVHIIMDLKCPDSGECAGNLWANLDALKPTDEIKFVVASRGDFDWAADVTRRERLDERFVVLFSAVFGRVTPLELATWLLESGLQRARMQLQMHKFIWDPQARGV